MGDRLHKYCHENRPTTDCNTLTACSVSHPYTGLHYCNLEKCVWSSLTLLYRPSDWLHDCMMCCILMPYCWCTKTPPLPLILRVPNYFPLRIQVEVFILRRSGIRYGISAYGKKWYFIYVWSLPNYDEYPTLQHFSFRSSLKPITSRPNSSGNRYNPDRRVGERLNRGETANRKQL